MIVTNRIFLVQNPNDIFEIKKEKEIEKNTTIPVKEVKKKIEKYFIKEFYI